MNRKINLDNWIYENTVDSNSVVELGAGFFRRLGSVHPNVKEKIGIEIYDEYIKNATYHNCIKIHGDALKYRDYVSKNNLDTVLIVDVLEHFNDEDALNLIKNLKEDFKKILLMLPVGVYEQNEDVTGHNGHEYQKHRSTWFKEDILKLNFTNNVFDDYYHANSDQRLQKGLDTGCYFGVWIK